MAMNKDSGDTRTYTANTLTSFQWRIPTNNTNNVAALSSTRVNWPGKIGYGTGVSREPNISVFCYACTFTSNDAVVLALSSDDSSFTNTSNGHGRSSTLDHAQVPGLHFSAVPVAGSGYSTGTRYWKARHATDDSTSRTFNISSI